MSSYFQTVERNQRSMKWTKKKIPCQRTSEINSKSTVCHMALATYGHVTTFKEYIILKILKLYTREKQRDGKKNF